MMKKNKHCPKPDIDEAEFVAVSSALPADRAEAALARINEVLPRFRVGDVATLGELKLFLSVKYRAQPADWKDIDKCTRTKVRRYNKYCRTVFCVSEGHVTDEEYRQAYIVKREDLENPSVNGRDFFYDLFFIVGSEDGEKLSSYFIGGYSEGFHEEMYLLCGNR